MCCGVHTTYVSTFKKMSHQCISTEKNHVTCFLCITELPVSSNSREATALSLCCIRYQALTTCQDSQHLCVFVYVCARTHVLLTQRNKFTEFCVTLNLGSGPRILFQGDSKGSCCLAGSGSSKCCLCACKNKTGRERKKNIRRWNLHLNLKQQMTVKDNSRSFSKTKSFCKANGSTN